MIELRIKKQLLLLELTLKDLSGEEGIDEQDFLDRVDILTALGQISFGL